MQLTSRIALALGLATQALGQLTFTESLEWGWDNVELTIPGIFSIESGADGFDSEGFQLAEALKCAVKHVNENNVLPKLVVKAVVKDARNDTNGAATAAQEIIADSLLSPWAITALTKDLTNTAGSILRGKVASHFAHYTPGVKLDSALQSNVIRVLPSDAYQVRPLIALLRTLPNVVNLGVAILSNTDINGLWGAFEAQAAGRLTIGCRLSFLAGGNPDFSEFSNCLSKGNVRNLVVFGESADVIEHLPKVSLDQNTNLFGVSTWASPATISTLVNDKKMSSALFLSTYVARPHPGPLGAFAFCLNSINSTYSAYSQANFRAFWERTFKCKLSSGTPCTSKIGDGVCQCTNSMKLNDALIYSRSANYMMDTVFAIVNAIAHRLYACPAPLGLGIASPYVPPTQICSSPWVNGTFLNTIVRGVSLKGLTGQVMYSNDDRSIARYDYGQFDGAKFVSTGNWTTSVTATGAADLFDLGVIQASATLTGGKAAITSENVFTQIDWKDPAAIAVTVLTSLGLLLTLAVAGFVIVYREHPVIKRASPLFCFLMLVGITIIYVDLYLWAGVQNKSLCIAKIWVPIIGFGTLMGPMLAKTFRIWKIFDNSKLRTRRILTGHLLFMSGIVIGINLILLIIWTAVDPLYVQYDPVRYGMCAGNRPEFQKAFVIVFAVYNSCLLLLGSFLSFQTRNVNSSFNESKFIGLSMYNLSIVMFVVLPIYYTVNYGTDSSINLRTFVIRSAGTLFANTACLLILFAPKVYHVIKKTPDNAEQGTNTGGTKKPLMSGGKSGGDSTKVPTTQGAVSKQGQSTRGATSTVDATSTVGATSSVGQTTSMGVGSDAGTKSVGVTSTN